VPYLVINTEGKAPLRKTLDGPTIIGRAHEADISIPDRRLSREHCRFEPTENGWAVIDLSSTNGTTVGGQPVGFQPLHDGDEVFVGRSRIVFHDRAAPPVRPTQPTRDSGGAAPSSGLPSPGDTLVDSRFPMPRIDPAVPSSSKTQRPKRPPLPFQRPPAHPQVAGAKRGLGIFRWLRRRLFRG
jgi:hypothetical protein